MNWRCIRNPLAGGAEIYFQEVFSRLVRRGHEVTLLAERFSGSQAEEVIGGIMVLRMGGKWTFNFAASRQVGRIAEEGNYDLVIDDLNKIPFYSPWRTQKPVLAILMHLFRGSIFREALPPVAAYVWLTESLIPWAYRKCRFAVLSESSKRDVVRLGIPAEQITVIPPGTDFERFRPEHQDGEIKKPATEPPVILHVGRLKKYKSTDHLLRAMALLKARGVQARAVIVGTGDDLPRLRVLAEKLQLGEAVEFTGFVSEEEKVRWYHRAAVLAENSVKEGWGLIVMEANACGTPVVVARSPGLVDSSREGVNGLFYEYGNIAQLAEKLELLLTNESLRAQLGRQAVDWARQWTWDKAAEQMEQVARMAVEEARQSGR